MILKPQALFKRIQKRHKIALVLGGGAARVFAHLGVLKVLEESGLQPDFIVGCSMGAIIGVLYAQTQDASRLTAQILEMVRDPKGLGLGQQSFLGEVTNRLFQQALHHLGAVHWLSTVLTKTHLLENEKIKETLGSLLSVQILEELKIPCAVVATDLHSGEPFIFRTGNIKEALHASSAIPGLFPPLDWQGRQLVDGSVSSLIPVMEARGMGADCCLAVDVTHPLESSQNYKNGLDIWMRADQIMSMRLRDIQLTQADAAFLIRDPQFAWHAFDQAPAIIAAGEAAARAEMPGLLMVLKKKFVRFWW
jgi:NTE family protein